MTTPEPIPACPACGGGLVVGDPAGVWRYQHEPVCAIGAAEDSRLVADRDRVVEDAATSFLRPTSWAERALLAAGSAAVLDDVVYVDFPTPGVRRRLFRTMKGN